jgi:hypothetical protein
MHGGAWLGSGSDANCKVTLEHQFLVQGSIAAAEAAVRRLTDVRTTSVHIRLMSGCCPVDVRTMRTKCENHVKSITKLPCGVRLMSGCCPVDFRTMCKPCKIKQKNGVRRLVDVRLMMVDVRLLSEPSENPLKSTNKLPCSIRVMSVFCPIVVRLMSG